MFLHFSILFSVFCGAVAQTQSKKIEGKTQSLYSIYSPLSATPSPSEYPTEYPTQYPTPPPSPTQSTSYPTQYPTQYPTFYPSETPTNSPTKSPSLFPTRATESPTFNPSSLPTLTPSFTPSLVPSSPSRVPTLQPSHQPSFNPTSIYDTLEPTERTTACFADCTYPGMTLSPAEWGKEEYCSFYATTNCSVSAISNYRCIPQCLTDCSDVFCDSMSTLVFACDSNIHGTYQNKTNVESTCLSSYSQNSQTETLLIFSATTSFDGVSPSEMSTQSSRNASIAAMSMSLSGVPANQISITNITGTESRRLDLSFSLSTSPLKHSSIKDHISVLVASSNVVFKITAILEDLGYTESSYLEAYDQLINEISASVVSGQFQQNLKAAGDSLGINTFNNAAVTKIPTYSILKVVPLVTAPPTSMPSVSPRQKPKESGDEVPVGAIIGSVIGGFIGLLIVAFIIYQCWSQKRRSLLEEKFQTHNFLAHHQSTQRTNQTSDQSGLKSADQVFDKKGSSLPINEIRYSQGESKLANPITSERRTGAGDNLNIVPDRHDFL